MGGMTNHEALRAATLNGARALGLDPCPAADVEGLIVRHPVMEAA